LLNDSFIPMSVEYSFTQPSAMTETSQYRFYRCRKSLWSKIHALLHSHLQSKKSKMQISRMQEISSVGESLYMHHCIHN